MVETKENVWDVLIQAIAVFCGLIFICLIVAQMAPAINSAFTAERHISTITVIESNVASTSGFSSTLSYVITDKDHNDYRYYVYGNKPFPHVGYTYEIKWYFNEDNVRVVDGTPIIIKEGD